MKNFYTLGLVLLTLFGTAKADPITITTPEVLPGDLIRADDWNKIKVDLESLSIGLDILTNQTWLPNGSDVYFNIGNVGIGTTTPEASLTILEQSPLPGALLIKAGTSVDETRFSVEEDGDLSTDGNILIRGGNVYDSDGNLNLSGEENLYLAADWDNDAPDSTAIVFGKNNAGAGPNFVELMRLTEAGVLGLGTSTPFATWNTPPLSGIELFGTGSRYGLSEAGGDRWAWQLGATGIELINDTTNVTPIIVNSAGQIGIAQPAPQRDLHVGGIGRFDTALETNLWCNQSGSGCVSQLLVQSLLASGNGPQACPAGFTMVGSVGHSNTFCIETNERVATDFWDAKQICLGLNDGALGKAHLCEPPEWYEACTASLGNALTGNQEWTDQVDANQESLVLGATNCETIESLDFTQDASFRCCY